MAERKLAQKQVLITQGADCVTIPEGGIPVIEITESSGQREVPWAVNFLRCGCPAVQMHYRFTAYQEILDLFMDLQMPGEELAVSSHNHPDQANPYRILFITRTVNGD